MRFGKRDTAIAAGSSAWCSGSLPLTLRHFGLWWPDGTTTAILAMFAATFFSNLFSVITTICLSSMVADVVEASQEQTGRRSEGTFAAGAFFAAKCSTGLGIFVTGLPARACRECPTGQSRDRSRRTSSTRLAMSYAACVAVLAIVLVLIVRRFPISREEHEARLAALDQAAKADPEATGQHP